MLRIITLKIINGLHDSEKTTYFEDCILKKRFDYTLIKNWSWENNDESLMFCFRAEGDPNLYSWKECDGKIIIMSKNTGRELFSHAHDHNKL